MLHHGPQGPVGRPLDEPAGVCHLLEQAAGDLLGLLVHVLLQGPEEVSQGADGQAGHLGAEVGNLGERWARGLQDCWALPRAATLRKEEPCTTSPAGPTLTQA